MIFLVNNLSNKANAFLIENCLIDVRVRCDGKDVPIFNLFKKSVKRTIVAAANHMYNGRLKKINISSNPSDTRIVFSPAQRTSGPEFVWESPYLVEYRDLHDGASPFLHVVLANNSTFGEQLRVVGASLAFVVIGFHFKKFLVFENFKDVATSL